jgi:hypothetical protein
MPLLEQGADRSLIEEVIQRQQGVPQLVGQQY